MTQENDCFTKRPSLYHWILQKPNQRITTDSALYTFVTHFFTRLPCLMTEQDLTPLLLDALGKSIEDSAANKLAMTIGKKPFKSATPNNRATIANRKLGLEVATNMKI